MKITFLLPVDSLSGGNRVVAIHAQWLKKFGHEVLLISQAPKRPSIRAQLRAWLKGQKTHGHGGVSASHFNGIGVPHQIIDFNPPLPATAVPQSDVVVATWWETAEWLAALPDDRGAKAYFVQSHEVFDYLPRARCEATYRAPFHKITVARWLRELMAERYGDSTCDLVPNAVDLTQFHAPRRSLQTRPTVGLLYHEAPMKGLDLGLAVVSRLYEQVPGLRVVAFGSTPPSGCFKLDPRMELEVAPAQSSLRHLYARCDVWLSTSRLEGFNLMAMEAMACRTPVVSTRTGWPAEAIRDGQNGFLVEIDDAQAAARAVRRVLTQAPGDWQVMSDHAWATVSSASWEVSARLFEDALRRACARASEGEIAGRPMCWVA